ncbi:MAG: hypothetical protein JO224_07265 [Pelomonas sp.]|nr:hypothetical protein [Roseateles sp.]
MIAIPAAAAKLFSSLGEKRARIDPSSCGWYESSLDLLNGLEVHEHPVDPQSLALWTTPPGAPKLP